MSATHSSGPIYSAAGLIAGAPVVVTAATLTVAPDANGGLLTRLNLAAGQAVTLPAATGSGVEYLFAIGITVTGSTTIKVANAADFFIGRVYAITDANAGVGFIPANSGTVGTNSDTITLNGTTKGGLIGDHFIIKDVAANTWHIKAFISTTGVSATPFSATV